MQVPFGEWLPDLPDHVNPGSTQAKNVYPAVNSYRPWRAIVNASGNGLDARCQGAGAFKSDSGVVSIFAGDATKLYKLTSNSFVDESGGTTFSFSADAYWDFIKFGEVVIAFNGDDATQAWTLDSSTDFADLTGSPPIFRHAAVINNFVVTGNQPDAQNKVAWASVNSATAWTAGVNQSDTETLPEGGAITGMTGGQYGLIFQENRITRMDYRGGNVVFSFRRIEDNRGAVQGKSVVKVGNLVYFLSEDGFYVTDGNTSKPIGNGKVDRFFFNDLKTALRERVRASVDHENKLVCWSYPSATGTNAGTQNDKIIIYHYESNRWSIVEIDHEIIFDYISAGYTLEELDDYPTSGADDIDAIDITLDSAFWSGGLRSFGVFGITHFLGAFQGNTLKAEIGTGETEIFPMNRSLVTHVRPIVDTDSATGSLTFRNRVADTNFTTVENIMHSTGTIPFHKSARYFKFNLQVPASTTWNDAQGIDIEAIKEGYR
tara:strand:+ start:2521 stop:3987 length:1467 start_codon:yes stop_codon:yes gene_type:complete